MATMPVGRLQLSAGIRYHRTSQGAAAIRKDIVLVNRKLALMQNEFRKINATVRRTVRGFGGLALAFGSFYAIRGVARFGQDMATLQAVTQGTEGEMRKLERRLRDLAATTRFTAEQSAEAATALGRAGFTVTEVMQSVGGALNLALVGQLEVADATRITADTLRGFGLEASQMTDVVAALSAGAVNANQTIGDIGLALGHAAPFLKKFGADLKTGVALLGTLANAGVRGERAGTALRQTMIKIADLTPKAQKAISSLNFDGREMTPADLDVGRHGIIQVLENLSKVGLGSSKELEEAGKQLMALSESSGGAGSAVGELGKYLADTTGAFLLADDSISKTTTAARILGTIFEARAGAAVALLLARFASLREQLDFVGAAVDSNGAFFAKLAATMRGTVETAALRVLSVWQELMLSIFRGKTGDSPVLMALKAGLHLLADAIQWVSENLWTLQAAFSLVFASAGLPVLVRITQGMYALATGAYTAAGAVTALGVAFRVLLVATGVFLVIQGLSLALAVVSGETAGLAGWVRKLGPLFQAWWAVVKQVGVEFVKLWRTLLANFKEILPLLRMAGRWLWRHVLVPLGALAKTGALAFLRFLRDGLRRLAIAAGWVGKQVRKLNQVIRDATGLDAKLASKLARITRELSHWQGAAVNAFSIPSLRLAVDHLEKLRSEAVGLGATASQLAALDSVIAKMSARIAAATAPVAQLTKEAKGLNAELKQFGEIKTDQLDRLVASVQAEGLDSDIVKLDRLQAEYNKVLTTLDLVRTGVIKLNEQMTTAQFDALRRSARAAFEAIEKQLAKLLQRARVHAFGRPASALAQLRDDFNSMNTAYQRTRNHGRAVVASMIRKGVEWDKVRGKAIEFRLALDIIRQAMESINKQTEKLQDEVKDIIKITSEKLGLAGVESPVMDVFNFDKALDGLNVFAGQLEGTIGKMSAEVRLDDLGNPKYNHELAKHEEMLGRVRVAYRALSVEKENALRTGSLIDQDLSAILTGTGLNLSNFATVQEDLLQKALAEAQVHRDSLFSDQISGKLAEGIELFDVEKSEEAIMRLTEMIKALREETEKVAVASGGVAQKIGAALKDRGISLLKGTIDGLASGLGQAAAGAQSFRDAIKGAVTSLAAGIGAAIAKVLIFVAFATTIAAIGSILGPWAFAQIFTGIFSLLGGAQNFLPGFASGGWVSGPGSATSDNLLARLSPGEFVVSAPAAARAAPVLEDINAGRLRAAAGGVERLAGGSTGNTDGSVDAADPLPREIVTEVTVNLDGRKVGQALSRRALATHGRSSLPGKRTSTA